MAIAEAGGASTDVGLSVLLQSEGSCLVFSWSWLELVLLTDCQVLQVWEENLVPGKNSFIK